jgi:phosphopentomutase
MARAFLFILDSFGIGHAPDAADFGDQGANTFGHIADRMPLKLPNMASLGLGLAAAHAGGRNPLPEINLQGLWGYAKEVSQGKDTITGHWEIAGVPVPFPWHYFPKSVPAFPQQLIDDIVFKAKIPGLLSCAHASGTQVIDEFGLEHISTGKPIAYTSVDSCLQIAAHEIHFGLQRLYDLCHAVRDLTYDMRLGRVIARPFLGESVGTFTRTGNRKDYSVVPPSPTLLKVATQRHRHVISVGKIGDIYAHDGTGEEVKVSGNAAMMEKVIALMPILRDGGLLMTNFVDFDTNHGHRRDPLGYGRLLEEFDANLPRVFTQLGKDDILLLTADHGNDPTWPGTDHTREQVPIMIRGAGVGSIGHRKSFADIGQSIATHLGLPKLEAGTSFF